MAIRVHCIAVILNYFRIAVILEYPICQQWG
jgi:hypothetical protein